MRGIGWSGLIRSVGQGAARIIPDVSKPARRAGASGEAMKTQAIRIERHGGPELMQVVEIDVPDPGPNQVRLKQHAAGLNFIDLYYRNGLYQAPLPHGLGSQGAGEGEAGGPRGQNPEGRGCGRSAR